jgi:GxxExxY protein
MKISKSYFKSLVYQMNGAAIEVHQALGAGFLESVYHKCMKQKLILRGIHFISEMIIPVSYKGERIEVDFRCDLLVKKILPVELKAVQKILPIHEAPFLTYIKLLGLPERLLFNFNVTHLYKEE